MGKPKVLIIEDDLYLQRFFASVLDDSTTLLQATKLAQAERIFRDHPDLTLVSTDACIEDDSIDVLPLVSTIRQTYQGLIIATSAQLYYRTQLLKSGCDFECEKEFLPFLVLSLVL
ncbi:hypothetical protein ACFLZY_03595 [Patescibacteria group bacterium]